MKIGIIGSGMIGGTLAKILTDKGYDVLISNSRGPDSLKEMVARLGNRAKAVTAEKAATEGDIVIEAIPFGKIHQLPRQELKGKVLISAANYFPNRDGMIDFAGLTQTEYVHSLLPDTEIAKVFNTIFWEHLGVEGDTTKALDDRRAIPFAASSTKAESMARDLIEALGFGPLFLGELAQVRGLTEPGDPLFNQDLTHAQASALIKSLQ